MSAAEWTTDDMVKRMAELEEERDALEAQLAEAYVPVKVRWSLVRPGDVIVAKGGQLLSVQGFDRDSDPRGLATWSVAHGPRTLHTTDPDHPVPILMARAERDALQLLRRSLGAVIDERP